MWFYHNKYISRLRLKLFLFKRRHSLKAFVHRVVVMLGISIALSLCTIAVTKAAGYNPISSHLSSNISATTSLNNSILTDYSLDQSPICQPDTNYVLPTSITPHKPGLTELVDSPQTYTVYGNTVSQIDNQIATCTPVTSTGTNGIPGKYAAETSNTVSWSINYTNTGNDTCKIVSVSVGMHINQVFPNWQPSSNSLASLKTDWQDYITKLHAYENGHVNLDREEGRTIYNDLENLPDTNCNNLSNLVNSTASHDAANYLQANSNYDITNNFGTKEAINL